MKFHHLRSSPVDDEAAAVQEIISHLNNSVAQLSHNNCSATNVQGYLICKFVKELNPITKHTKAETVLHLVLNNLLQVEQDKVFQIFISSFYNNMALDMRNAVENLKINVGDIIVLHRPVLCFSKSQNRLTLLEPHLNKAVTVEIGLGDDQAIDVWQYCKIMTVTFPKSVSNYYITKTLKDLIGSTSEDTSREIIISYFIKPVQFWKKKGKIVKALCYFREIQPNGKVGSFFKLALHKTFAQEFHRKIKDNSIVSGDIIIFVNPEVYYNPGYKSDVFLSGEPYFLEIGRKEDQNIGFCYSQGNIQLRIDDSPVETPITCLSQTAMAGPQTNSSYYPSILPVSKRFCKSQGKTQLPIDHPPVKKPITCTAQTYLAVPQINSNYSQSIQPVPKRFFYPQKNVQLLVDDPPVENPITSSAQTSVAVPQINSNYSQSIQPVPKRFFYPQKNVQLLVDDPPVENPITSSAQTSVAVPQINSNYSSSIPPVSKRFCKSQGKTQIPIDNPQVENPITSSAQTSVAVPQINSNYSPSILPVSKRFCKSQGKTQLPIDNPPVENPITSSAQTTMAVSQTNSSYSPSIPPVSNKDTSNSSDETCLIPVSLVKPSKDTLGFQNLSLVSGYCNQFCHKMFMHSEILWNRKDEPLCPKCLVTLQLCLCLELDAMLGFSGEFVKIFLVGPKAERLLQVSCKDFMDNDERRKLAVKVLESKYLEGSEYKHFHLKVSDVSHLQRMV